MSTSIQNKQTIAVFGATGGCVLNFLIRALQEGHTVSALARTPSKLTTLLKENDISDNLLSNLTIIQGNAKNETNVAEALQINGQVADVIVSGVGAAPVFKGLKPSIDDPQICQDTMATILKSLTTIRDSSPSRYKKPILVAISTTGISEYGRDIPVAMIPLYHGMLGVPHKDKRIMESMIKSEGAGEGSVLGGWIIVRPSFLLGDSVGWEKVRVGVENGGTMPKSAFGYTINRVDVGRWIYGALVEDKAGKRGEYLNKCLGITT